MAALFADGRIVDLILALTALEALVLVAWHRRTGRGPVPADLAWNLAAGVGLMLALRCALVDAWWGWIALSLTAALLAHVTDLARRARG